MMNVAIIANVIFRVLILARGKVDLLPVNPDRLNVELLLCVFWTTRLAWETTQTMLI